MPFFYFIFFLGLQLCRADKCCSDHGSCSIGCSPGWCGCGNTEFSLKRGFYCDACTPCLCDAGFESKSRGCGSSTCDSCPPGKYSFKNDPLCRNCDPGQYCDKWEMSNPVNCPPGTYSVSYNRINICNDLCLEGYFCPSGTGSLLPSNFCPKGNFCPIGSDSPTPCPKGTYQDSRMQGQCKECPPGTYGDREGLQTSSCSGDCSAGYYCPLRSTSATQFICNSGNYCGPGVGSMTPCQVGKYNSDTGATSSSFCRECGPGKFAGVSGSSSCSSNCLTPGYFCPAGSKTPTGYPCPPGRYGAIVTGAILANSNCTGICTLGHYCPLASPNPLPCPPGRYGSTYGLSTSLCSGLCKPGFYCPASSSSPTMYPCPSNMTSLPGATTSSDCYTVRLYDTRGIPLSTSSYTPTMFASVTEGTNPIKVWSTAGVDSISPSLFGANVSIIANCAPGDNLTFDTLTTTTCGATLALLESHTAADWQTFFSSRVTLTANHSNNIPLNAPRLVRFSLHSPSTFVDIPVYITPINDAPTPPPINFFNITEGDPAEVLLVVTDSCPLPSDFAGGENVICITDPDPRLGRALTSSSNPHTDTYFGNQSASLSPSLAFQDGGSAQSILSNYALTTIIASSGTSSSCGALVPLGGVIWDCTTLAVGSNAWDVSQTTIPVAAKYNGMTFPSPHSPYGWRQPSLLNFSLLDTPCLAQRYRLVFSSSPPFSSPLPDDGCGTWNPGVSCSIDYEAAYCGSQSYGSARTISLSVTVTDSFKLASGSKPLTFPFTLNILNAPEPPALTWADATTLVSLSLCPSIGACLIASPSTKSPNFAALDDVTLSTPISKNLPVLLVCSQEPPPSSTLGITINTFPLEGPSVFDPSQNANTLFNVSSISNLTVLNSTSSPACFAALAAATLSKSTIANSSRTGGVPSMYVQAFSLVGLNSSLLMQTPSRAFNLILQPSWDPTGAFNTFTLPTNLVRANRNVSWALPPGATAFNLTLMEQSQIGTVTSLISVKDDDLEQDVTFSVLSVSLDSCNGFTPTISYSSPTNLFVPTPILNSIAVTDYATGQTSLVNATRSMRIGVGVDGLDLNDAGAACGVGGARFTPSILTSCLFRVRVRATDSGNSTPSHSLLYPQPPTTADATLLITVNRPPLYSSPEILSIDGVPPAGLNTAGGNALIITGSNLGLPMGQSIFLQLSSPPQTPSPFLNFTASSPCTVITRLTTLSCIVPSGWGLGLDLKLLYGSNTSAPYVTLFSPASISYASATAVGITTSPISSSFPTQGGGQVTLSAYNLPPSPFTALGWQGVLRRSTAVWGVPSEVPMNCSNIQSSTTFASIPPPNTLTCMVPPGVGSGFTLDFQPPSLYSSGLPTVPTTTSPARVSSPPPLITSITQDCVSGGAALCSRFMVWGQNLGAPDVLSPNEADPAAYTRSLLGLQGFDMVQYAMLPTIPPSQCVSLLQSGSKLSSSCALHIAVNCSYFAPHTAIACSLDPNGWGAGFSVRVIVKGQVSQWWGGAGSITSPSSTPNNTSVNASSLSYPTPILKRLDIVWVAGASQAAVNSTSALANGGSLARLQGEGLSPLSQVVISVGGVTVMPFGEDGVGGYANTAPPSNSPTTSTTTIPPVYRLDGSLDQVSEPFYAPQQSLLICIPPGFGVVDVVVWVGGRSASIPLTYTPPSVADFIDLDKSSVDTAGAILSLKATNIPSCALCFSPLNTTSSVCTKVLNCSSAEAPNTVCKYHPPPTPWLPSDITPYTCPAFSGADPEPLLLSSCALPSVLWTWGGATTSANTSSINLTSSTFSLPCFSPVGKLSTSNGTLSRCMASNPTSLASFFKVSLGLQQYSLGQEAVASTALTPITLYQTVFNPGGDLLRVEMSADLGFIMFEVASYKLPYTLSTPSLNFNKFNLLGTNPSIASLNFSSPLFPDLEPHGGEKVSLSVNKGGSYGVVLVYPDGMPLSVTQQRSETTVPECSSQPFVPSWGPQSQYYNNSGWKPGPFICPVTLQSNLTGDKCCDSKTLVEKLVGCNSKDEVFKPFPLCSLTTTFVRLLLSFNGKPRIFKAPSSSYTIDSFPGYASFELASALNSAKEEVKNLATDDSTFLSRMVYEPCPKTGRHWIEMPAPLPCRVSSWNTNNITFLSPPWQGKTWVTFAVDGQYAANFFPLEYAPPLVSNLTYTNSTQGGGVLTIVGSRFGNFPSLGSLWLGSGANNLGYRQTPSPTLGANYVLFNYPGVTSQFPSRVCTPVLLWTDTLIRCVIPEGVSGSPNQVVVYHNVSSAPSPLSISSAEKIGWSTKSSLTTSLRSKDLTEKVILPGDTFVYAQGKILNCSAPSFGTDGNYSVVLLGTNLSRFLPSNAAGDSNGVVTLFEPGPSGPPPLDCSVNNFWRAVVNFRLLSGIAGRSFDFSSKSLPTTFHSHTSVNFTMPVFEGDVGLSLMYTSLEPFRVVSTEFFISADPPVVTSVTAFSGQDASNENVDPCSDVAQFNPPPPPTGVRATTSPTNLSQSYYLWDEVNRAWGPNPKSSLSYCLWDAWGTSKWASKDFPTSPTSPCFRSNATSSGVSTLLRITGRNFGYTGESSLITIIPSANSYTRFSPIPCKPTASNPTVLVNSTTLECSVDGSVPFGPVEVEIAVAFKRVNLTRFGITLTSQCACGSFFDPRASPYCQPCPPGGTCRGGGDKARAIAGAWETFPEDWADSRQVSVDIYGAGFPRFVPCPQEFRCLGDNVCKSPGTQNYWMCTKCEEKWEEGNDLTCQLCTLKEKADLYLSLIIVGGLVGGLLGTLFLFKTYVYDRGCCGRWPVKQSEAEGEEGKEKGDEEEDQEGKDATDKTAPATGSTTSLGGETAGGTPSTTTTTTTTTTTINRRSKFISAPLGSYIKVMLTYAQTLGALAAYTKALIPQSLKGKTNQLAISQLLPVYLSQLGNVLDVGLSSHALRCVIQDYLPMYVMQMHAVMVVPFVVAFTVLVVYLLYTIGGKLWAALRAWWKGTGGASRNLLLAAASAARTPRGGCCAKYVEWSTDERLTAGYLALLFTFLSIPMVIRSLASLQDCAPETSGLYLRAEPSISCNDAGFSNGLQTYALGMGWLYLAFPAVVGMVLYGVFGKVNLSYFKFLVEGYKLDEPLARAWECLVTVRKSLFVGLSASFVPRITDPRIQLVVTMFFITVFLGVQQHYRPLKFDRLNDLDGYALASQLAFCFSVMIRQQGSSGERVFSQAIKGSYNYYFIDSGSTSSTVKGLGSVTVNEQAVFDLVAAYFATRFLFFWVFYLLDDKISKGVWSQAVEGWVKSVWGAVDSGFMRVWIAAASAAKMRGGGKEKSKGEFEAGSLSSPAALATPALTLVNANVLFAKRTAHATGWRHVKNPDGRSMFYPPEADMYESEAEVKAEFPEGDSRWTLPVTGLTLSGWHVHVDQLTGKRTALWECEVGGVVTEKTPPMDFPGAEDVTEGEWVLYWRLDDPVAPVWLNVRTEETELDLNAFPDKAVTRNGWTFTPDPDGRLFWLNLRTLEALWDFPQEEYTKSVWEVARPKTPPTPLPSTWVPIWDSATRRPLYWLNVELLLGGMAGAGKRGGLNHGEEGMYAIENTPSGALLGAALEPPMDPTFNHPPHYPTTATPVLNGGWRWKESPLSERGFYLSPEWWPEDGAGPPPDILTELSRSLPPSLQTTPPQFNVWFQCNYWVGPSFWVNLATGASLEGVLPIGASTLSGWRCEVDFNGKKEGGEEEREEVGGGVKYVNESTGLVQRAIPPFEGTEHFLWLIPARDPWEWCGKEGVWRRRRNLQHPQDSLAFSPDQCTSSQDIPVGHSTVGGWRHVQNPLFPSLTLWIHPLLKVARPPPFSPSFYDEDAGAAAPTSNSSDIWRMYDAVSAPPHPTPSSLYRKPPMLPIYWKQDCTGAVAFTLPLDANLPGGWVHTQYHHNHGEGGDGVGTAAAAAGVGQFFHTLTGASTHSFPPVCHSSYASAPCWRFSRSQGNWWEEGSGKVLVGPITQACPLPGGWSLAPSLLGQQQQKQLGGVGAGEASETLCFVNVERREVREWENPPPEVLEEARAGEFGGATPIGALHKVWRKVAKGEGGLKVWVEDVTGAERPFEPPDHADLGGGWSFSSTHGAYEHRETGVVKYSWEVEDSAVKEEPRFIIDK